MADVEDTPVEEVPAEEAVEETEEAAAVDGEEAVAETDGEAKADGEAATEEAETAEGEGEAEETDEKKKINKPRPLIPSRLELRQDRIREQQERTILIGPANLEDLMNMRLMDRIKTSQQFFIRFFREEPKPVEKKKEETENGEGEAEGEGEKEEAAAEDAVEEPMEAEKELEFHGHVEIRFATVEEADSCCEELADLREGITVKRISYEFTKSDEYKQLRKIGSPTDSDGLLGSRSGRIVALTGLDPAITREDILGKIPDAVEVMFPKNYGTNEPKGYVYIEISTNEKAKALEGTFVELGENKHKVYVLEEVPSLDNLIRRIDKERINDPFMYPPDANKQERLRTLLRYAIHYERLEELPKSKVDALKKRTVHLRERIKEIRQAQGGRGGRGGRGGPRGGRGNNRARGGRGGMMRGGPRGGMGGMRGNPRGGGMNPRGMGFRGRGGYGGGYQDHGGYGGGGYGGGYDGGYGGGGYGGGYNNGYGAQSFSPRGGGRYGQQNDRGRKRTFSGQGPPQKRRQGMWFD